MKQVTLSYSLDESLTQQWHKLWSDSHEAHFFNTPEWFLSYCDTFGITKKLIVTITENDALILVFPLVLEKVFGVSSWVSPGGKFLNKSSLLVKYVDKTVIKLLIAQLMKLRNVYLRELSEENALLIMSSSTNWIKQDASLNPYLLVSENTINQLSGKLKNQIQKSMKQHAKAIHLVSSQGELSALETTFTLDSISSKAKQGKATFITKRDRLFLKTLVDRMPDRVAIDILFYNKSPIIYSIGLFYKETYEAFLTAYDPLYRKMRPGKLLTFALLGRLQETKVTLFDFSRGVSPLKQEFTKMVRKQSTLYYSSNRLIKWWWIFANKFQRVIIDNKIFYTGYLLFKKSFL